MFRSLFFLVCLLFLCSALCSIGADISGELKKWHKVTLTFEGPESSEYDTLNPFLDYRLDVEFKNGELKYVIPGFYAADGNAAESSARSGNKWQVRFSPDMEGTWTYKAKFRTGSNIAVSDDQNAGRAVSFDGASGSFFIANTDKSGRDLRAKGRLHFAGDHYLVYKGSDEYYLKGGANSPEDLLAFHEFDQTPDKHHYPTHLKDWQTGDVTWKQGKGKALIGALNYLASTGMNAVYFLTMNVQGDGKNVWPWTAEHERYRFDVSKLDQWEMVFDHMDKVGLVKHVITQETENENLLDIGHLGIQRKLYYRELVARFSHHNGLIWNMGEENGIAAWTPVGQTEKMRIDMVEYMKSIEPYGNVIAIHTLPELEDHELTMTPFLGNQALDAVSFQVHHLTDTYYTTSTWRDRSSKADKKWVVWLDEIGPASVGVLSDLRPEQQDTVRKEVIWANLMAGGAGVEHYFGYKHPHSDLSCEDWRSRARIWTMTNHALSFFMKYLPFNEMEPNNQLIDNNDAYCFVKANDIFSVYLKNGGSCKLNLSESEGVFEVKWYDPRNGGGLKNGSLKMVKAGGWADLGTPPSDENEDWVILLSKKGLRNKNNK